MIRRCIGNCGKQNTVMPLRDNRVVKYECTDCRNNRLQAHVRVYRSRLVQEVVIHEKMVEYRS